MSKKLLVETTIFKPTILKESKLGEGLVVRGVLQRGNTKNKNGRIYPTKILQEKVKKYLDECVGTGTAYGELDHSDKTSVDLKNTSHIIVGLKWEGDNLMGDVKILPTPSGNIVKTLIENGCTIGISSRAVGNVEQINENTLEVQGDLELICWDIVSNPSTPGAYLDIKINESKMIQESYKYNKVNYLIRDILCNIHGQCCVK